MNNNATNSPQTGTGLFPVIEFRRYTIKPGGRKQFSRYFEAFFPEAFQQLGAMALGEFFEREQENGFTWLRGFPNMETRAVANASFYYGPLWKEHKAILNGLMDDSDNVILMRPLDSNRGIPVMPAVDPVREPEGAQGIIVAQLFAIKTGGVDQFATQADKVFARYREAGIKEAGVLVTLDAANNFPQLPVRTDGPYLLWLGIVQDQAMFETAWQPLLQQSISTLSSSNLLRHAPEAITLDPAPRSRLRWQVR
jgi:hypothetical protein